MVVLWLAVPGIGFRSWAYFPSKHANKIVEISAECVSCLLAITHWVCKMMHDIRSLLRLYFIKFSGGKGFYSIRCMSGISVISGSLIAWAYDDFYPISLWPKKMDRLFWEKTDKRSENIPVTSVFGRKWLPTWFINSMDPHLYVLGENQNKSKVHWNTLDPG